MNRRTDLSAKGTLCPHVMKGGPRKTLVCNRPNCYVTGAGDRCYHHTPERMSHQAAKERNRLADMTPVRREFERGEDLIRRKRRADKARMVRFAEEKERAELDAIDAGRAKTAKARATRAANVLVRQMAASDK